MEITALTSLDALPRVRLAFLPTPLQLAPRLTAALGGPRIYIKRDDMTGLALGGNKTRKLEYLMADARAHGADTVLTTGAPQSNHCRQTAAAARQMGMRCILVFSPGHHDEPQGNVLLDHVLKAELVRTERSDRMAVMQELAEAGRRDGHVSYVIPVGGSNGMGSLGYANAWRELSAQLASLNEHAGRVYFSSGSGGTHGGLLLGQRVFGASARLVGVSPSRAADAVTAEVVRTANEGAQLLGMAPTFGADEVEVRDDLVGPGYGVSTPASLEAIRLFAETEGVLLDPVYTAKAAAALMCDIRSGLIGRDAPVVFVHTGGAPALFAYRDDLIG